MDNASDHWTALTTTASPAASHMQAGGDGFRTDSEDQLNRHYSSHFDPTPRGPPCTASDELRHCAGLPPFLEPSDPEEILINTVLIELKKHHTVKVNWTPALAGKLLKLYQRVDKWTSNHDYSQNFHIECPATNCSNTQPARSFKGHWQQHCFVNGLYHCDSPGCSHKSKRWGDLARHITTSHCLAAKRYPCSYPGCERGGDNGFPRKDKLKDHFENIHRGVGIPPKQPRALAPKK
ncbi:MAG: hypothetical protein Q9207_007873 [Kuettlingeria erythrocarpa]